MSLNSKSLSFLLSFFLAVIAVAVFAYLKELTVAEMVLTFVCLIAAFFSLFYASLEFLLFRQINKLADKVLKARRGLDTDSGSNIRFIEPLQEIESDFDSFRDRKIREIEELKKITAFRKEFIADVSHELKTPLFAAQGFVHTLLDGAVKDKSVRERFLKKAARSLDGLDLLVQDLLSLSRIETGDIKLHYEYIDLVEMTSEVFEQFENRASKKGVKLSFEDPEILPPGHSQKYSIYADSSLIYQVMINLVGNGLKYSKDHGSVTVGFVVDAEDVIVKVKDNGRGIPSKDIPHIFERFYRVDKSRSKEKDKGGTGLGLAIVKHILEAHHSQIKVESTLGKGSTFKFKLPRDRKRAKAYSYK